MGGDTQLYTCAAAILTKVQQRAGTVKSLCLTSSYPNKKKLYALVCETLRYASVTRQIIELSGFLKAQKRMTESMALVLLYDELFGSGVRCGGGLQGAIASSRTPIKSALARLKAKRGVKDNADMLPPHVRSAASIPRYVRVNTLKTTVDDVIATFVADGYKVLQPPIDLSDIRAKCIARDAHLSDVLVVAANTDFHAHPLYLTGNIILQDKASCMPAHALSPPPGSHVIDACAAPGNKTSHVAAMVGTKGKVFAFDIDPRRLQLLKTLTGRAGAGSIIEAENQSFLLVDPLDPKYEKVEYILLDPSCSGSGIVSRLDHLLDAAGSNGDEEQGSTLTSRLESLAQFQTHAILHAFKFPHVHRVSYSTCSIHQTENEDVVAAVLATNPPFALVNTLPHFEGRGLDCIAPGEGPKCVRVTPEQHHTNGFFVAVFERVNSANNDSNEVHANTGQSSLKNREISKKGKGNIDNLVEENGENAVKSNKRVREESEDEDEMNENEGNDDSDVDDGATGNNNNNEGGKKKKRKKKKKKKKKTKVAKA